MNKKTGASMRVSDNITSSISLSTPRIPELEGKVKIELFNAKTGELEQKVEGKNLVTNVVKDIFAENPFGITDYSLLLPIHKTFFGGILCFQNTLTESASNYYLPTTAENPVVAHAGQTTYASAEADTTRGNPNDVESGEVTNGFKYVWDFASTQGNGTISALAMCSPTLGDWHLNGGTNFTPFMQITRSTDFGLYAKRLSFFDKTARKGYVYQSTAASTFVVRELLSYGVVNNIGFKQKTLGQGDYGVENFDYVDHTYTILDCRYGYVLLYQGNIHVLTVSGSTISRTIINTSTWATTSDTLNVTLPSGASLVGTSLWFGNHTELDSDGYLYISGSNNKVYKIKYTDVTDVVEINDAPTHGATISYWAGYSTYGKYATLFSNSGAYIYEGNKAHLCSSSPYFEGGSTDGNIYENCPLVRTRMGSSWDTGFNQTRYGMNVLCKLFLSTIKNLPSPVTKDSTMTMKITYTITEVEEES